MLFVPLWSYLIALNNCNICIGYCDCELMCHIDKYKFWSALKCKIREICPPHFLNFMFCVATLNFNHNAILKNQL